MSRFIDERVFYGVQDIRDCCCLSEYQSPDFERQIRELSQRLRICWWRGRQYGIAAVPQDSVVATCQPQGKPVAVLERGSFEEIRARFSRSLIIIFQTLLFTFGKVRKECDGLFDN
jgi:hypothetical protein